MRPLPALLVVAWALGCSLPIDTVRIDSRDEPARGVRYRLMRPEHTLGLRVPDRIGATPVRSVADLPGSRSLASGTLWIPADQPWGRMWRFAAGFAQDPPDGAGYLSCAEGAPRPTEVCKRARASVCFVPQTQTHLAFTLSAHLASEAVYEVRGRPGLARLAHLFSDTTVSVVLDDQGRLSSVSAGETDKTLEVIAMLAGLATSAAALGVDVLPPEFAAQVRAGRGEECNLFPLDEKFAAYVQKHGSLRGRIGELRAAETRLHALLARSEPARTKEIVESLKLLEERRTALEAAEKTLHYALPPYAYTIQVQGRVPDTRVAALAGEGGVPVPIPPWVTVTLQPKPFSQTPPASRSEEKP